MIMTTMTMTTIMTMIVITTMTMTMMMTMMMTMTMKITITMTMIMIVITTTTMNMKIMITMTITMTMMTIMKVLSFVRRYSYFWTYQIQLFSFSPQCFIVHIILTILLVACTVNLVFHAHEMSKAYDSLPPTIRINLDELYLALVIYNGSLSFRP